MYTRELFKKKILVIILCSVFLFSASASLSFAEDSEEKIIFGVT